jgi:hypothetical protein
MQENLRNDATRGQSAVFELAKLVLGLVGLLGINSSLSRAADEPQADRTDKKAASPVQPVGPWRAFGRVTDEKKRPLAGVEVWASAALRFERPQNANMRAWFGNRELRLEELVIRIAGPGVHGRTATPVAGNAGMLDLTAADPLGVLERSDTLLAVKRAVLTLRNAPRHDLSR